MIQVLAMAIKLLRNCLEKYVKRCGEVVEVHTNVGRLVRYIAKDCYPKSLDREGYIDSIRIHRCLEGNGEEDGGNARDLKAYYIY